MRSENMKSGIVLGLVVVLFGAGAVSSMSATMDKMASESFGLPGVIPEHDVERTEMNVEFVSSCRTEYGPTKVFVRGGYAYVTSLEYQIQPFGALDVITIEDPENPRVEGTVRYNQYTGEMRLPVGVYVKGDFAYVTDVAASLDQPSCLYQINVSHPSSPHIASREESRDNSRGVFCLKDYVYEVSMSGGLTIYKSRDHSAGLSYYGHCYTPNSAVAVYVYGNYAYIADNCVNGNHGTLTIVDVSNPRNPELVSRCKTSGENPISVWVVKKFSTDSMHPSTSYLYALVADMDGLQVFNVTNPHAPLRITHYEIPGETTWVHVQGNYAFVSSGGYGIEIVDISDPEHPTQAGYYRMSEFVMGVFVQDNYIFVADGARSLQILRFLS